MKYWTLGVNPVTQLSEQILVLQDLKAYAI